ncbi:hypothetical protein H9P43_005672 [Blastocladiella emersonii ATCC 22665]|nr:hypothetical protein H9P43_005652 [Blastocladiella emersonii ATCC 22665]KAI9179010.1 hypothetical protein H9P43_005672 [Blastocladiella emersonii ATCC 22665]
MTIHEIPVADRVTSKISLFESLSAAAGSSASLTSSSSCRRSAPTNAKTNVMALVKAYSTMSLHSATASVAPAPAVSGTTTKALPASLSSATSPATIKAGSISTLGITAAIPTTTNSPAASTTTTIIPATTPAPALASLPLAAAAQIREKPYHRPYADQVDNGPDVPLFLAHAAAGQTAAPDAAPHHDTLAHAVSPSTSSSSLISAASRSSSSAGSRLGSHNLFGSYIVPRSPSSDSHLSSSSAGSHVSSSEPFATDVAIPSSLVSALCLSPPADPFTSAAPTLPALASHSSHFKLSALLDSVSKRSQEQQQLHLIKVAEIPVKAAEIPATTTTTTLLAPINAATHHDTVRHPFTLVAEDSAPASSVVATALPAHPDPVSAPVQHAELPKAEPESSSVESTRDLTAARDAARDSTRSPTAPVRQIAQSANSVMCKSVSSIKAAARRVVKSASRKIKPRSVGDVLSGMSAKGDNLASPDGITGVGAKASNKHGSGRAIAKNLGAGYFQFLLRVERDAPNSPVDYLGKYLMKQRRPAMSLEAASRVGALTQDHHELRIDLTTTFDTSVGTATKSENRSWYPCSFREAMAAESAVLGEQVQAVYPELFKTAAHAAEVTAYLQYMARLEDTLKQQAEAHAHGDGSHDPDAIMRAVADAALLHLTQTKLYAKKAPSRFRVFYPSRPEHHCKSWATISKGERDALMGMYCLIQHVGRASQE